ncbi:surface-adhesin E family protein [Ralstonia syzygii]|uniref:Putative signal peptide (Transmembrane) protein n=1 Tax=Ralstonia syzygii R24 TaxID=907261 RepID=G3A9C4_9RALS|nr:surface-adhesin E family protein [Ralstonia syzygii]CCA87875.1 putative signal peptide (transmembrane) protein [Ralstonia syzygii R24]
MKTGGWRRQGAVAATVLVAAQWVSMPVFAQDASTQEGMPAAAGAPGPGGVDARWRRFVGMSGVESYLDRQSVRPQTGADAGPPTVSFRLLRNVLPDFIIKTSDGQPIRSSVKQVVLDCAHRSYTVIAQTLYRARNAMGKPLYQIRYGSDAQSRALREGSVFDWIAGRFCTPPH